MQKLLCIALLAGMTGLAGCAPAGVNNSRSLGSAEGAPAEVVVVEAEPNPEQARADEVRRQRREIAQLREQLALERDRSTAETARAEASAQEAQESVRALQRELTEVRALADTASAQSNQALATATEFLSNLVAAREEQRLIIERNQQTSSALESRLSAIEGRATEADQQLRTDLAQTSSRSAELERQLQQADQDLAQLRAQLADLNRANEETRAAIDSGPMLRMLRDLEATQRETSVLRGLVEDMQREQEEGRQRLQNYYQDLDARIQALQEDLERAARKNETSGFAGDDELTPAASSVVGEEGDDDADGLSGEILQSGELGDEARELLKSFEDEQQRQAIESQVSEDAVSIEAKAEDAVAPETAVLDDEAATDFAAMQEAEDLTDTVPGIVSTIDSVPAVPDAFSAGGGDEVGEAAATSTGTSTGQGSSGISARDDAGRAVMFDSTNVGETGLETDASIAEPQPVTTHGLIVTDWRAGLQQPVPERSQE